MARGRLGVEWKPSVGAKLDRKPRSLQLSRPRLHAHGFAVERDAPCFRGVLALFDHRRPSAIARRVAALIVDPFHGVLSRRPWPHVGQKSLERLAPFCTDRDTTPPVAGVKITGLVFAAPDHALPDSVFGCLAQSVRAHALAARFHIETTAAGDMTASERACRHDVHTAAGAITEPAHFAVPSAQRSYDRQASELLASQICTQPSLQRSECSHEYHSL